MEFPTNKRITEDQIRKLVSESANPINPLSMTFTYEYVISLVTLNWSELFFAIKNIFLPHQAAIEHALLEMQNNENPPMEVMELSYISQSEAKYPYDICQLVEKLAKQQTSDSYSKVREKFLYISLNWVYEHKDDYCNPIEVVDILCDDMNYPDEVKNLISFMPTSEPEIISSASATERLFNRLGLYLESQRKRWA